MAEHIDRLDASTIPVLPVEQRVQFKTVDEAYEEGWRQALEMVAMMEPADELEVRHGRWHRFMKGSGQAGNVIICSDAFQCTVCKESFWNKSNFCPNCGAKMDGGQDDA